MNYWISRTGKREGPYQEWDIRDLIESGKLMESDLIWCEGQEEWQTLEALAVFRSSFLRVTPPVESSEPVVPPAVELPPPLPTRSFWWRRAFARIFDYFLYYTGLFIFFNALGIRFGIAPNLAWLELVKVLPFIAFETILTKRYGWTVGKWLMDLKVVSGQGGLFSWKAALYRSVGVWFFGMAFGIQPLFFFAMLLSYLVARKRPQASWELMSQSELTGETTLRPLRIALYVVSFFALLTAMTLFVQWHGPTAVEYEKQLEGVWQQYPALRPK